ESVPTTVNSATASNGARLEELEHNAILDALAAHGGNVSATARALGISRNTIYRKLPNTSRFSA
ncbi:helix-turn-helix domain-containing protein, partial [Mesorhizobium japonicum]|uniref:helix-turn-helix domain-containing protein n=1 Tax=Mesorhizobium japonicum TaxID=2066070 RepID=UPI003B5BE042